MEKNQSQEDKKNPLLSNQQIDYKSAADQLRANKGKVKSIWEKRVREKVPVAEGQTSLALINSMEIFLDELILSLEHSSQTSISDSGAQGMSKRHGGQRAKFVGYFLPQLLKEFSILREVLIEDLNHSGLLTYQASLIINRAIDASISSAATEFVSVQQDTLKVALEKAEASNKELEHFAAVAAHDLKSPLATISSFLDLIKEDHKEELSQKPLEYISIIQKTSERMRNLVDRLLDYAQLAKTEESFQTVDINNVMKSVLQNLTDSVQKTRAQILYDRLPPVKGDINLLTQLFQNLIANSIKFHGKEDPLIQINFKVQNEMILFSLQDNGIGFDPENKERIFDLYKKLRADSESQGVGIGLATCKKVVELHGGRIWAESKPGLGSIFYFTLPSRDLIGSVIRH